MNKKHRYLKWLGILLLGILLAGLIAAGAFYFFMLKPRIDVVTIIGKAFSGNTQEENVLRLEFSDGMQCLMDLSGEEQMEGVIYDAQAVYDGVEFGFRSEGLWVHIPQVSTKYYLIPWTDDVQEQTEDSPLLSILRLNEEQKTGLCEGLWAVRDAVYAEEDYIFEPTWLNRMLGLECLKADILDLYKGIEFKKEGRAQIEQDGETLNCEKYTLEIPQKYVKPLLKTDGAGRLLEKLGDVLGDISMEVYICDDSLVCIDVDTSFVYMPVLNIKSILAGGVDDLFQNMQFTDADLQGRISVDENGVMAVDAQLSDGKLSLQTAFTWEMLEEEHTWGYGSGKTMNLFQAGKLQLLLEAAKWEEAINGKSTD